MPELPADQDIEERLGGRPAWRREGDAIVRLTAPDLELAAAVDGLPGAS